MIQNSKSLLTSNLEASRTGKIQNSQEGFSLIELIVAMFILATVMGAMVSVSVAVFRSYQKSKAIKTVTEDVGFAINSMTKNVRMGKVESAYATGSRNDNLLITRNIDVLKICYKLTDSNRQLVLVENSKDDCTIELGGTEKVLVNLTDVNMVFDSSSGFRSWQTQPVPDPTTRGWVEINFNIENPTIEMDSIRVQTVVSSRDYGWEDI